MSADGKQANQTAFISYLLQSLKARDEMEHGLDSVIDDYEILYNAYQDERKKALQFRQDLDGLCQRPSLVTDILAHDLDSRSEEHRKCVVHLQEELSRAYSVIGERDRALAVSHNQQQEDESLIVKLQSDVSSLEEKLAVAQTKILSLSEENEKLKPNISSHAFESLRERCHALEKENQNLLTRIKETLDQPSEAMNEMNDFVNKAKSLLNVARKPNTNANEESSTILDPVAWANIFKEND